MQTRIIEATASAHKYQLLIKSILTASLHFKNDNEIVYKGEQRYSYSTFYERVCRLAYLLKKAGINAGDTVAVLDWDSHRYLECYFAIPMIGAVLHHVNIRLSEEQILYTMNHAEDKLVLTHDDFIPVLEKIHTRLETVNQYIQISDNAKPNNTILPTLGSYEDLMSQSSTTYDFPDFNENSVATVFYTTGTTGNPKGVYFSHRQLVLHTMNMQGFMGAYSSLPLLRSNDVYMPLTPMFHVHAWGAPYVAVLLGVKQVYPGRYEPNEIVKLKEKEGVTYSHCVPTILQMLLSCEAAKTANFNGMKMVIGGSALSQGLAAQAMDRGIDIYSGYGMSETCPLISTTHLTSEIRALPSEQQLPHRSRTTVSPFVDLRILDAEGNTQPHDGKSAGEIVVRAPWLTEGYLNDPQKSEELWLGGWLHTGDIACMHPDGTLEIKDRIKDIIKTGGEWISSLELENLISQHPDVASVAVIGLPDDEWGERPYALVVAKTPDQKLDSATIQQHLMQYVSTGQINKWWIPQNINLVDNIPITSVGKIDKKVIREWLSS